MGGESIYVPVHFSTFSVIIYYLLLSLFIIIFIIIIYQTTVIRVTCRRISTNHIAMNSKIIERGHEEGKLTVSDRSRVAKLRLIAQLAATR